MDWMFVNVMTLFICGMILGWVGRGIGEKEIKRKLVESMETVVEMLRSFNQCPPEDNKFESTAQIEAAIPTGETFTQDLVNEVSGHICGVIVSEICDMESFDRDDVMKQFSRER